MSVNLDWFTIIIFTSLISSVRPQINGDIRLTASNSSNSGLIEVFYNGSWGGVCDDGFDSASAVVACRQLGFPTSSPTYNRHIQGSGGFLLDEIYCHGSESNLSACQHNPWGDSNCGASEHVTLTCAANPCKSGICDNGGTCEHVIDGQYRCHCSPEYTSRNCETDINECVTNNGGCSHVCVNMVGSHRCECPDEELHLNPDRHTCFSEGLQVLCTSQNMMVTFDKRHFHGIHGQYLSLRDKSCTARDTPTQVKITVPLQGCGTQIQKVGSAFVYENQVTSHTIPVQGLVTRVRDMNVTVRCYYDSHHTVENFYVVNTAELTFSDHSKGSYQISMDLLHNGTLFHPTQSLSVEPGENLSIKLSLQTNDSHLQVFSRNCKATPTPTTSNTQQYLILDNGCTTDPSLTFKNVSDVKEQVLSLETFKFLGNSSTVYLQCEVLVCNVSDPNSRCHQGCLRPSRRKKRDAKLSEEQSGVYLSSHELTAGPVQLSTSVKKTTRTKKSEMSSEIHHRDPETSQATLAAGLALLGVVLVMVTIALSIVFKSEDDEDKTSDKDDAMEKLLNHNDDEK